MRMTWQTMRGWAGWLLMAGFGAAHACVLPVPFQYEFQNDATATLSPPTTSDPCALSASLAPAARSAAAAILHYRRATPLTSVRYGFRLDHGGLVGFSGLQAVQVFSASAPTIVTGLSHVLDIALRAPSATPTLSFTAAAGSGIPISSNVALAQTRNVVRVEINVGAGTAGNIRYWINHTFTDPPDGVIDNSGAGLNTAAFQGVIAAAVGLGAQNSPFRSAQGSNTLVFDQIESSDDVLFYDDFSSGAQ